MVNYDHPLFYIITKTLSHQKSTGNLSLFLFEFAKSFAQLIRTRCTLHATANTLKFLNNIVYLLPYY